MAQLRRRGGKWVLVDDEAEASGSGGGGEERGFTFKPPLYRQRYQFVIDLINQEQPQKLRKLVDFGCAECGFLRRARFNLPHVRAMAGVDVDAGVLETGREELADADDADFFLDRRARALRVQLFRGDVTQFDSRLADVDVVTCIELIEHLEEPTLVAVSAAVLGRLRPRVAVFTTPNVEFNVLFDMSERQFRHDDHKFEWTREQFRHWAEDVVKAYPAYRLELGGVGEAPVEAGDVGWCSQIAVFRCDATIFEKVFAQDKQLAASDEQPYEEVLDTTYAFDPDGRRDDRIAYDCDRIFSDLLAEQGVQLPRVTVPTSWCKSDREVVAVRSEQLFARLDAGLRVFCPTAGALSCLLTQRGYWRHKFDVNFTSTADDHSTLLRPTDFAPFGDDDDDGDSTSSASDDDAAADSQVVFFGAPNQSE